MALCGVRNVRDIDPRVLHRPEDASAGSKILRWSGPSTD